MNIEIIFCIIFKRHFVDFNAQQENFKYIYRKKVVNINVRALRDAPFDGEHDLGQVKYLKHKVKAFL